MATIATLGPSNTISELAARHYASRLGGTCSIKLYPTFGKALTAATAECEYCVLPIENMTEGFVSPVLDLLVNPELSIADELLIPVQFSLVANCASPAEIEKLYAQFVTQGQCERFIDTLGKPQLITTGSNGGSLEQVLKGIPGEAAIVPAYSVRPEDFPYVTENIADYPNNQTRFVALARTVEPRIEGPAYKTSILIFETVDRPGVLSGILNAFAARGVNLMSIMSRPTKEALGRYHFFVDIDGHHSDPAVREAFAEIGRVNTIRMLGSYPKATAPVDLEKERLLSRQVTENDDALPARLRPTPFAVPGARPRVVVTSGDDPYANTRAALASVDLTVACGKRVLIKPNAGRAATAGSGITTHPQVVAAVIDALRGAGAEVAIGESPVAGVDTMQAFNVSGIAAIAKERTCPLIDMDKRRFVKREIPGGIAIRSLRVCREVLEYDLIVSVPVMKMHMHTGVTLSVKNMKGCLWRRSKVDLHMLPEIPGNPEMPLNVAIADMSSILTPHLAIIDGTVGMEGLGPSAGSAKKLGVIVVSADPFAADAVACVLMGTRAEDVPHLRMGAERGLGQIDLRGIDVASDTWRDRVSAFAPPPQNLSIEFPGVKVLDAQSCSACQSTLLLFLKRYGKDLQNVMGKVDLSVAIGKGHDTVPPGTLCVGNCTARYRKMGIHVTGCPPVASEILRAVAESTGRDLAPHD